MSAFERYLTLWVAACIVVGIGLGHLFPGVFQLIGGAEVAKVNLPVAVLIWLMIIPMLMKIDFAALSAVRRHWRGIGVTLFVNWAVKPFSMALLGWLFIGHLFRPYLPADQIDSYIAGLILLAAAPCTAMVFVWSNLCEGEPHFTLVPGGAQRRDHGGRIRADRGAAARLSSIVVPWDTLLLSVGLYIVVPVIIAQVARRALLAGRRRGAAGPGPAAHRSTQPPGTAGDAGAAVRLPGRADPAPAAGDRAAGGAHPDPGVLQFRSGLSAESATGEAHCVAGPSALIGASNFFELAVAAAISIFGFESGAALATVVGVLIEVPVMLSVVRIVNRSRGWYQRTAPPA